MSGVIRLHQHYHAHGRPGAGPNMIASVKCRLPALTPPLFIKGYCTVQTMSIWF